LDAGDLLCALLEGLIGPELGVGRRKSSDALDGREEDLSNIGALVETEGATNLVVGDELGEFPGVHEDMVGDVFEIAEDEGLLDVESEGDKILCVFQTVFVRLFKSERVLEQGLFVVRQHEYEGYVEHLLQPARELQRDGVSQVQAAGTWTTARVEEEGLALFILVEDLVEIAMAEEEAATKPAVGFLAG